MSSGVSVPTYRALPEGIESDNVEGVDEIDADFADESAYDEDASDAAYDEFLGAAPEELDIAADTDDIGNHDTPAGLYVEDEIIRVHADGSQTVDIIIRFDDAAGAIDYVPRVIKL